MNILEQLVHIITKHKIRATEIMGHPEGRNANSYYQRLYNAIAQDKFETEDEYAQYLGKGNANSPEFKRLKNDLEKRLVNHIFLIDIKKTEFSEQYQAFYNAWKYLAASKILQGMGTSMGAIKILKKAHKFAILYDHTDVALETSRKLKQHYATITGNKKKYNRLVTD